MADRNREKNGDRIVLEKVTSTTETGEGMERKFEVVEGLQQTKIKTVSEIEKSIETGETEQKKEQLQKEGEPDSKRHLVAFTSGGLGDPVTDKSPNLQIADRIMQKKREKQRHVVEEICSEVIIEILEKTVEYREREEKE